MYVQYVAMVTIKKGKALDAVTPPERGCTTYSEWISSAGILKLT